MRKLALISIISLFSITSYAQSEEFNKVFDACMLARSSMSSGEGSQNEIEEAASALTTAEWGPLILTEVDVKNEASFKNHIVFSPEYLNDVAKNHKVKKLAKKYAEEQIASQRGGDVKLCTKCIKGEKKVIYALRHNTGGNFNIAAVAETGGLINMSVIVKDANGNESEPYKIRSEEFKGATSRKLENIPVPKGNSKIYITIENKSKSDKSVAIIVE